MTDINYNKLPKFLKKKAHQDHSIVSFGGHYYINLMPYALYKINGEEFSYTNDTGYRQEVHKNLGCTYTDVLQCEIYNHSAKRWINLLGDESRFKGAITRHDIEKLDRDFDGFWEVDYDHEKGYISFDIQKWIHAKFGPEIMLDLPRDRVYSLGSDKKFKIKELGDWDESWRNWDQDRIVIHDIQFVESFCKYMTEEISAINFEKTLLKIYNDVKSGTLSYEEFIKLV